MPFSIDPLAFFLAFVAVFIAIRESRRSHRVLIRILDVSESGIQSIDENNFQIFHRFQLIMRNEGISLHDVQVAIEFRDYGQAARLTIPLRTMPIAPSKQGGEFAHGMVGVFGLKSYQLHPSEIAMLGHLKDPIDQDACISIYSQGYIAKRFEIGRGWDWFAMRWNATAAARINPLFIRWVKIKGKKDKVFKLGRVAPDLQCLFVPIKAFAKAIQAASTKK